MRCAHLSPRVLTIIRRANAQAFEGRQLGGGPNRCSEASGRLDYPARKDEVIAKADQNGAPQELIEALQALAEEQFDDPAEVQAALG